MYSVVSSSIRVEVYRYAEIEIVVVSVAFPDAHSPCVAYHIDGSVEIVAVNKLAILVVAKHIHEVFIS